jgi:LmbE family N-acetylglucosaminyl deacetylase
VAGNGQDELEEQLAVLKAGLRKSRLVCLAVVSHCDDEALGPGALLFELQRLPGVAVFVLVLAADNPQRRRESQNAALVIGLDPQRLLFASFPDGDLGRHETEIAGVLRWLRDELRPGLVITHRVDAHPDHCVACGAVLSVFGQVAGTSILHHKIPQHLAIGWKPNVYVRVSAPGVNRKLRSLRAYRSQSHKDYFDRTMHLGQLIEAGHSAGSRFAEAFETDQLLLVGGFPPHCALALGTPSPATLATPGGDTNLPDGTRPCVKVDHLDTRLILEPCQCGCGAMVLASPSPLTDEKHIFPTFAKLSKVIVSLVKQHV